MLIERYSPQSDSEIRTHNRSVCYLNKRLRFFLLGEQTDHISQIHLHKVWMAMWLSSEESRVWVGLMFHVRTVNSFHV